MASIRFGKVQPYVNNTKASVQVAQLDVNEEIVSTKYKELY